MNESGRVTLTTSLLDYICLELLAFAVEFTNTTFQMQYLLDMNCISSSLINMSLTTFLVAFR